MVTIVDEITDQKSGNSTPRCSKTDSPVFQLVCTTSRRSQVTSSYGCTPGVVKMRSIARPRRMTSGRSGTAPAAPSVSWDVPLTISVMSCVPS